MRNVIIIGPTVEESIVAGNVRWALEAYFGPRDINDEKAKYVRNKLNSSKTDFIKYKGVIIKKAQL